MAEKRLLLQFRAAAVRGPSSHGRRIRFHSFYLVFRQNTLEEAIRILQRYYPCKIELRDSTSRVRLSGTHDNKSLESVLESICFSAGLHYTENDGCYIIY